MRISIDDFAADTPNDWCAGCGDFGILRALEKALVSLALEPHQVSVFGGIGCSGKTPYYLNSFGIHTLHGRPIPFATGAKLAQPDQTIIAIAGDGDGLGIGAGHLVNAGRRNIDITYILCNNEVYGLTKGQAAPTLRFGERVKAMPEASLLGSNNPILIAMTSGFSWIAREYSFDVRHLTDLIVAAIRHRGTSFLEILQPCPTYNDLHTKKWFADKDDGTGASRFYHLDDEEYDPFIVDDRSRHQVMSACLARAMEWGDRIPLGVFLNDRTRTEFTDMLDARYPGYLDIPPCDILDVCDSGKRIEVLNSLYNRFLID